MGILFARSLALLALLCLLLPCHGKLSTKFYAKSCPGVATIVRSAMAQAVAKEPRMGASIIRLFFHDCFVNVGRIYYPVIILLVRLPCCFSDSR
jgi:peroxidase